MVSKSRADVRDLIRRAQSAELNGNLEEAVAFLQRAAEAHAQAGEAPRAASLVRHCLRLRSDRPDLSAWFTRLERGDTSLPPALEQEQRGAGDGFVPRTSSRLLELAQRGPMLADRLLDAWCSFCCRPQREVGRLVAGPAGAYICGSCVAISAGLLSGEGALARPEPAAEREPPAAEEEGAKPERGLIEAAVILARRLGWSLSDVRSLTPEQREKALALSAGLPQE